MRNSDSQKRKSDCQRKSQTVREKVRLSEKKSDYQRKIQTIREKIRQLDSKSHSQRESQTKKIALITLLLL